jgi:large subunit ribosomal protein L25
MSTLSATLRESNGKGGAREIRRRGMVPGIIYGSIKEPRPVAVPLKDLVTLLEREGESGLIDVVVSDGGGSEVARQKAVIRQVDYHPLHEVPIHVDFMAVAMDRKINLSVPLELVGTPVGVTINKGLLSQIIYDVEIECLPDAIPHTIPVDISRLNVGQSLHVEDLVQIPGVRILTGREQTIVTVDAPKGEEVLVSGEERALAEPEVISRRKEEE